MSKIAVIYWSGTGNTEQMAQAVAEGAQAAGAQVETFTVDAIDAGAAAEYSKLALGCPAMGAEVLEESEWLGRWPVAARLGGAHRGRRRSPVR